MKFILRLTSLAEGAFGLLVVVYPPIAVHVLFGAEIGGVGVIMSRLAGNALISLGVACWPGNSAVQQLNAMLTYSTLAMLYLIYIGVRGEAVGLLLWPAVVAHAIFSVLLARARFKEHKPPAA